MIIVSRRGLVLAHQVDHRGFLCSFGIHGLLHNKVSLHSQDHSIFSNATEQILHKTCTCPKIPKVPRSHRLMLENQKQCFTCLLHKVIQIKQHLKSRNQKWLTPLVLFFNFYIFSLPKFVHKFTTGHNITHNRMKWWVRRYDNLNPTLLNALRKTEKRNLLMLEQ